MQLAIHLGKPPRVPRVVYLLAGTSGQIHTKHDLMLRITAEKPLLHDTSVYILGRYDYIKILIIGAAHLSRVMP